MTLFLQTTLIAHILLGLIGIALTVATWVGLIQIDPKINVVKRRSFGSFVSFILSWILGGYYYVVYYGSVVKPIIKGGQYPWVHAVIMEAKEHIFLFLPFLSLVLFLSLVFLPNLENLKYKKALINLAAILSILGVVVALMGSGISGAVR